MYKITENCEGELKTKITPKILAGLKKYGLLANLSEEDQTMKILDVLSDKESVKELFNLIFVFKSEPDWDEADIGIFLLAYRDFFFSLVENLAKQIQS